MIRRPPRSTQSRSSAASDVYKRQNYTNRSVLIHPDLDPAHRVKTLAHELGHITLHEPGDSSDASTFAASCRGRIEVEAESVAFLVTSARGAGRRTKHTARPRRTALRTRG